MDIGALEVDDACPTMTAPTKVGIGKSHTSDPFVADDRSTMTAPTRVGIGKWSFGKAHQHCVVGIDNHRKGVGA